VTVPSSLTLLPLSPSGLSYEAKNGKNALAAEDPLAGSASMSFGGDDLRVQDSPDSMANPQTKQEGPVRMSDGVGITSFEK